MVGGGSRIPKAASDKAAAAAAAALMSFGLVGHAAAAVPQKCQTFCLEGNDKLDAKTPSQTDVRLGSKKHKRYLRQRLRDAR